MGVKTNKYFWVTPCVWLLTLSGCRSYELGTACDDGRDNDKDGAVDCADPDCEQLAYCAGEEVGDDEITPTLPGGTSADPTIQLPSHEPGSPVVESPTSLTPGATSPPDPTVITETPAPTTSLSPGDVTATPSPSPSPEVTTRVTPAGATPTVFTTQVTPTPTPVDNEIDADGDGYGRTVDCDDGNPSIHPGAIERCYPVGIDEDCDGGVDAADQDLDPNLLVATLVGTVPEPEPSSPSVVALAVSEVGTLHVLVVAAMGINDPDHLYHLASNDGGLTWGDSSMLNKDDDASIATIVTGANGVLDVVWVEQDDVDGDDVVERVVHRRSLDEGENWSDAVIVGPMAQPYVRGIDLADGESQLWLGATTQAGYDSGPAAVEVWTTRGEVGWTSSGSLGRDVDGAQDVAIAVDGAGELHVLWGESTVVNSPSGGHTEGAVLYLHWSEHQTAVPVSLRPWSNTPLNPGLALLVSDEAVWAMWPDDYSDSLPDIVQRMSFDGGYTFGTASAIAPDTTGDHQEYPQAGQTSEGWYIAAWQYQRTGYGEVHMAISFDPNAGWPAAGVVDERQNEEMSTSFPKMAAPSICRAYIVTHSSDMRLFHLR